MVKNKVSAVWNRFALLCTVLIQAVRKCHVCFTLLIWGEQRKRDYSPYRFIGLGHLRTSKDI